MSVDDSSLSALIIDGQDISISGTSLTITLPSNTTTALIVANSTNSNAAVTLLDSTPMLIAAGEGSLSYSVPISAGSNSYLVQVVAEDRSGSTLYTLTIITGASVVCFLGNAPVATPTGPQRIDSLKEGDLVLTESGKPVPIQRLKVMRVRPGPTTNPYIIAKGSYGATEELLISPRHCVAVGGKMIEARDLGLPQKTMKKPFTYYNIELPGWANMRVAGVEVESLAPAKRVIATVEQVKAAIAAMKGPKTADVLKTLQRLCKRNADGTMTVYGAMKA
jgi:hypothetical protein